jgi:hypothetical protein
VASITGTYLGDVVLTDQDPPGAFTLRATGAGAPGTVDATVRVRLIESGEGTRLDYDADAAVGGPVGGVGQRMLAGVARKTAAEFFAAVDRTLAAPEEAAVTAGEPAEAPEAGAVFTRPPGPPSAWAAGVTLRTGPLAAMAAGAAIALVGVAVGWALGRRRSR